MKTLLAAAILVGGMAGTTTAQEYRTDDCARWKTYSDGQRVARILGWLQGIQAADSVTSEEIMSKLWPRGHRVGSVELEVTVQCEKPGNQNAEFIHIIQNIARRLNGIEPLAVRQ